MLITDVEEVKNFLKNRLTALALSKSKQLILKYPEKVELRDLVAEAYYQIGDKYQAGLYWYLSEDNSEEKEDCVLFFEEVEEYDSGKILFMLLQSGVKPHVLESQYALGIIESLREDENTSSDSNQSSQNNDLTGVVGTAGGLGLALLVFKLMIEFGKILKESSVLSSLPNLSHLGFGALVALFMVFFIFLIFKTRKE